MERARTNRQLKCLHGFRFDEERGQIQDHNRKDNRKEGEVEREGNKPHHIGSAGQRHGQSTGNDD